MNQFVVKFKNAPELICQLNNTPLANRYYELVKQQYTNDPSPIFRDQQKYTMEYFTQLVNRAQEILGWNWHSDCYDLSVTTRLHKYIEEICATGFKDIPEEYDDLIHEIHFALHSIESGSRRDNWLQIEWFNNNGFIIDPNEYPAKLDPKFGDIRLQNPYVGHHPLYLYEQQDSINVMQTCKFHNFCKPGINIVILDFIGNTHFDKSKYLQWFKRNAPEFVAMHGESTLMQFTGHPVVGSIVNLDDLHSVISAPVIEFEYLKF